MSYDFFVEFIQKCLNENQECLDQLAGWLIIWVRASATVTKLLGTSRVFSKTLFPHRDEFAAPGDTSSSRALALDVGLDDGTMYYQDSDGEGWFE